MTEGAKTESSIAYNASDVAALLGLKQSTLRKYANVLQKAGYTFHRNEQGHRGYFDKDVMVIRRLMETKQHPDMTLEKAAEAVMSWSLQGDASDDDTTDVSAPARYVGLDDFVQVYQRQDHQMQTIIKQNQQLLDRLDRQEKHYEQYIEQSLKRRDEELVAAMHHIFENKAKQKPGFLKRLFS